MPKYIVIKLQSWIDNIAHNGLNETRKLPGYHDEPLNRAIYTVTKSGSIEVVNIVEVNKHDY